LSRAALKVQDGCTQRCSYCIVPDARPGLKSRPISTVIDEAERLLSAGHCEVVLTGTHLGLYGLNWSPSDGTAPPTFTQMSLAPRSGDSLTQLVRRLLDLSCDHPYRIRLSSLEAPEVTQEIIRMAAERPDRFCPHFHLPMQHAADPVLRRMRRRWSSARFTELCLQIQETLPMVTLSTDVMVGFPGETDGDFAILCDTIRRIGFGGVHIFRYSRRIGTEADRSVFALTPSCRNGGD
ncbi:MAG: radical SAM protein, partial [Planctomycetia bacterium]|nr:radical SAM protein [Planctomycetia bacterium]